MGYQQGLWKGKGVHKGLKYDKEVVHRQEWSVKAERKGGAHVCLVACVQVPWAGREGVFCVSGRHPAGLRLEQARGGACQNGHRRG